LLGAGISLLNLYLGWTSHRVSVVVDLETQSA
jgi:hypothetical protein